MEGKKMNQYERQAIDFLKRNEIKLKIFFVRKAVLKPFDDNEKRNIYRFVLISKRGSYSGEFGSSILNSREPSRHPTAYDILSCLDIHDTRSFNDFISSYGYGCSEKPREIYNGVKAQNEGLRKVFTPKQLEELQLIS